VNYDYFDTFLRGGRDPNSRPLQNNTRVERRGEDIAVRLHATDVVVWHPDETFELFTGGWYTVTTKDRINGATPARVYSDGGNWFVDVLDPDDPEPERPNRTIPRPFEATNPGPEPVKSPEGCLAGTERSEMRDRTRYYFKSIGSDGAAFAELVEPDVIEEDDRKWLVRETYMHTTHYVEPPAYNHPTPGINGENVNCPHCVAFERLHANWSLAFNGDRWPRGIDSRKGWQLYSEMMAKYGTREAWQAAYLDEFRDVRDRRREWREWRDRNRVAFFDGIHLKKVDGRLACLNPPSIRAQRKHVRANAKMKQRIAAFVKLASERLAEGMNPPGPGDCWYCCMRTDVTRDGEPVEPGKGQTWGDMRGDDHDHLLSHMDESYVVPSLLYNAVAERGYPHPEIILGAHQDENGEWRMGGRSTFRDGVERALRAYLTARLVPSAAPATPAGAKLRHYSEAR
jgi:hypothetical protein